MTADDGYIRLLGRIFGLWGDIDGLKVSDAFLLAWAKTDLNVRLRQRYPSMVALLGSWSLA